MKREYLIELGLEDEIIDKVLAENGKDIEREKGKAEAAKADAENLKTQLADRDKDLEELKKNVGSADEIKAQMMKNGAVNAMMSGSGPTVFGIFDDPEKAEFARDQLKISGLSKQTFLTTVSKPGGTKYGKK